MRLSVALTPPRLYNARAKRRPVWKTRKQDATHRRLADGRGVFSAGDARNVTNKAEEQSVRPVMHPLSKLLLLQLGLCMVLAMLFWGTNGHVSGYSALLGGLTCVIPNAFLALRLVVPRRDPGARALLRAAYIGETGKLALTLLMFSLVFTLVKPLAPLPLFAGFIACQLATFSGLLMRDKEQGTETKHGE